MGAAACTDIAVRNLDDPHLSGQLLLASVLHGVQLPGGWIQLQNRQILCDFPVDLIFYRLQLFRREHSVKVNGHLFASHMKSHIIEPILFMYQS